MLAALERLTAASVIYEDGRLYQLVTWSVVVVVVVCERGSFHVLYTVCGGCSTLSDCMDISRVDGMVGSDEPHVLIADDLICRRSKQVPTQLTHQPKVGVNVDCMLRLLADMDL